MLWQKFGRTYIQKRGLEKTIQDKVTALYDQILNSGMEEHINKKTYEFTQIADVVLKEKIQSQLNPALESKFESDFGWVNFPFDAATQDRE